MSLKSDLVLDGAKFAPDAVSDKTKTLNAQLLKIGEAGPVWYEVGAAKYREMRRNGQTAFPKPIELPAGQSITIPSRDAGRTIPARVFAPPAGAKSNGIFLHIHGGGWVLQDEKTQDPLLAFIASAGSLTVISVGYRLAPEHPFPAGPEDCYDAAMHLAAPATATALLPDAGELLFIGGESAGGHLSVLTALHLLEHGPPGFTLKGGVLLNYGAYDLAGFLPQTYLFGHKRLMLNIDIMTHFLDAFVPGMTIEQRRDPAVSPFFADLGKYRGRLPSALFTIGTEDPLLDDSVLMAAKWTMGGGEAVLKVYEGEPHGFTLFPPEVSPGAGEAAKDVTVWLKDRLGKL